MDLSVALHQAARPDQDGKYQVAALPSPSHISPWRSRASRTARPAIRMEVAVRDRATKFDLGEGETKSVDVRLTAQR